MSRLLLSFVLFCYPVWAQDWSEYRSTNFVVYTDERRERAEELLRHFEQFRSAVLLYMNLGEIVENQRMMVLMFRDQKEFEAIAPKNAAGFYKQTDAGPRMVVDSQAELSDSSVVLFHEYVHYLIREHSQQHFPKWYDEGLAEFLASAVIEKDKVLIGALHPWRSYWLKIPRWIDTATLLDPPREESSKFSWERFYAAAWLAVHHLEMGSLFGYPDYAASSRHYLNLYNQGIDSTEAFQQAFNLSLKDMDRQMRKYRRERLNKVISFPATPYKEDIQVQVLNDNQQSYLLADLAWRLGKQDLAMNHLEQLNPEQEDMAQALALRAVLKGHREPTAEAEAEVKKALELAPNDAQVLANAGHFYLDRYTDYAREQADPEGPVSAVALQAQDLEQALNLTEKAVKIDPEFEDGLHQRILALRKTDNTEETLKAMMAYYRLRPSNISINLDIGEFLLKETPRPDLARPFLERVKRWVHSEDADAAVDKLLHELDKREAELTQASKGESAR